MLKFYKMKIYKTLMSELKVMVAGTPPAPAGVQPDAVNVMGPPSPTLRACPVALQ
jgi:hypothetical protein